MEDKELANAHLLLSKIYEKESDKTLAKQHFEKALALDKEQKHEHLWKENFKNENYAEAAKNYIEYIKHSQEPISYHSKNAEIFFDKNLYKEAISIYAFYLDRAEFEGKDKLRSYNSLGLCYLRLEDYDSAYINFKTAYEYDKDEVAMHQNMYLCGKFLHQKYRFKKAVEILEFCIANFEYEKKKSLKMLKKMK